jgi:hypothetical protein
MLDGPSAVAQEPAAGILEEVGRIGGRTSHALVGGLDSEETGECLGALSISSPMRGLVTHLNNG